MFLNNELKIPPKIVLQAYDRYDDNTGGICWYGVDDSHEDTWEPSMVSYPKPVVRQRKEIMQENKRLYLLGVYEDDDCKS